MKISARNQLSGTVTAITPGAVIGQIKVGIGRAVGGKVTVLIKASDVLIGQ